MKRNLNRLMGLLLTIALAIGLMAGMSITALADNTGAYNSYLVKSNDTEDALEKKVVSFNGIDWYIINDESTALNAGTVTLLAKNCLGASAFGSFSTYKGSTVETWLGTYYSEKFGNNYNDAVVEVTPSNPEGNKARLWLVSKDDIPQQAKYLKCSQATGASYNGWWLRSPGISAYFAAVVFGEDGNVGGIGDDVRRELGVRPALKLNLSSVIFNTEPTCIVVKVKNRPGTLIYNGKEQQLVIPGTTEDGTMVYLLGTDDVTPPEGEWSESIPTGKDVGEYFVWYIVQGDENHNDTEPMCIKVTIIPDSQVEQVMAVISMLPDDVTLEDEELVEAARYMYDLLSENQKTLIPEEAVRKLEEAEAKIRELKEAAQAVAEQFTEAVNAVPGNKAGEGKGLVDKATEIYNSMTDAQKALVSADTMALYKEAVAAFKKDRKFRSGTGYYKVLSNGDVTYHHPASTNIEEVTVPNQVKKGEFYFKVIKVSNNAFRSCQNLRSAVIGKYVRVLGENIFARDYKLTEVTVLGKGLKAGKVTDAFVKAGKNGKLTVMVPGSKVKEYRKLFTGEGGLKGSVKAA